jgi:site-specific DNA-methyltransferase (adenine-specific)
MKPNWIEQIVAIKDLKEYERNPRRIKDEHFKKLVKSLKEDGYHQRLVVNKDMVIIGGHQRKRALLESGFSPTTQIPVLMPDRLLEGDDFKRINIRDNLPFGEFDFDMLTADFDVDELLEWGVPEEWLPIGDEIEEKKSDERPKDPKKCPHCGEELP